jgi:hypothetical protein
MADRLLVGPPYQIFKFKPHNLFNNKDIIIKLIYAIGRGQVEQPQV